ncbi:immunoglobulin lambda-like polypeptide 1 [Ictalurus furcatus]|uniref:immunoglobulin lambda-like polypeptide 1 n=1 Tax=Ictalurus furcatus TaxID=66913 RepID=UPI002350695C|nr:immunoglobulin lambda-like polypeptide 1 [Ictalurus furcatus]
MTCNTVEILSRCDLVYWYKVQPRTREMILATAVHTDPSLKLCRGFIYNTSVADSGIYYCSVKHSVIYYTGNGTTVIVTEPRTGPVVTLYVPDVSVGPSVSLQCVVMGVVPSEAIISWVVGDSETTGWTESGWTHANASAVEYTRAHISIPSETWLEAPNVECVVEVDGRRVSKSFKKASSQVCPWLLYLGSGVVLAFITVIFVKIMLY